jgi:hypothetical protein
MIGARPRRRLWRIAAGAWAIAAVAAWNGVFDARIRAGARAYVDQQQAWVEGRGARADMDHAMDAARSAGLRDASLWTGAIVVPGLLLAARKTFRRAR